MLKESCVEKENVWGVGRQKMEGGEKEKLLNGVAEDSELIVYREANSPMV